MEQSRDTRNQLWPPGGRRILQQLRHLQAGRLDNLSDVRALAALVVFASHVVQIGFLRFTGLGGLLHRTSSLASEYAVIVFFVLSGFLIAHTLELNIERNGRIRVWEYLVARFARLYSPLVFAVAVSLAIFFAMDVWGLPGRTGPIAFASDLYHARDVVSLSAGEVRDALALSRGMLDLNGPLWSLYIEAKPYVLYVCALAVATSRRHWPLAVIFVVVLLDGLRKNPEFLPYAVIWLTGALAHHVVADLLPERRRHRMAFAGAAIVAAIAGSALGTGELFAALRGLVAATVLAWILFRLEFAIPMPRRLADCSYSLYVTHFPVLLVGQSLLVASGDASFGAASIAAVLAASAAMAVALAGGLVEVRKPQIQAFVMVVGARVVGTVRRRIGRAPGPR